MTVTVKGDTELVAALSAIGDGLAHLDGGAKAAAELLEVDARGRAPKRTGTLAASIRGTVKDGGAQVGTPVRYGLPVHFGVPSRNQRPQPFLFDAIRARSTDITSAYVKDAQALIDRSV